MNSNSCSEFFIANGTDTALTHTDYHVVIQGQIYSSGTILYMPQANERRLYDQR